MGIPFYFKKIFTNFPDILQDKHGLPNANLFLDFNGIIHQCSHKVTKNEHFTNADIFESIREYLDFLNDYFKPTLIYIAVDGVAPLSKIKQQRQRRFKTIFYRKERKKIFDRHGQSNNEWNSNCITPGTEFMEQLNKFLGTLTIPNVIVSGSDEKGEGEHKIFTYIKKHNIDNIIIHGLDADLIMLSLLMVEKTIVIYRENENESTYLNINMLRSHIVNNINDQINFETTKKSIIYDYVLICFLLGNDFLPKVNSLDIIVTNGLNIIEGLYISILNKYKKHLVVDCEINPIFFKQLLLELSSLENRNILKANKKYMNKRYFNKHSDQCEIELHKLEFYPLFHKKNIRYDNIFDWKHDYYNYYFKNTDIREVIKQYLIGLNWILSYYINNTSTTNWYYPYFNSPFIVDIVDYLQHNELPKYTECIDFEITEEIQLCSVLHKDSHYLLPKKLRNISTDLSYLYPVTFKIDTHMCTYLHQCMPFIPNFNISDINNYIIQNTK